MSRAHDRRSAGRVRALLATGTWLAVVVALTGFTSLLLDADVVPAEEAGPLLQPAAVLISAIVMLRRLLSVERRAAAREPLDAVAASLGTGALVHVVAVMLSAVWILLVTGGPVTALAFGVTTALSPFTAALSVGAAVVAALHADVARRRATGEGPPTWPWEPPG